MTHMIDAFIGRTRTVLTIMAVLVVAGLSTYVSIPKEADPDVPVPIVRVAVMHPGISPEDAERLIIKPLETRLRTIEGLKETRAYASQGNATIILEFDVSFQVDQALLDVREQVDLAKADLPDDSEEPVVSEINLSLFPVISVALSGDLPERSLNALARRLQDRIETIPTVLEANLTGNREELLEVVVDPAKLESYNISQGELISVVANNNRLVAAGSLDTGRGRFQVKVPGLFETREDVLFLPIKVSGDGVVRLSDIADIRRTFKDSASFARFNGKPTIAIEVVKRIGANIIETNLAVRALVAEEAKSWPEGVEHDFTQDQSHWIYSSLGSLEGSIMTAILLVMIIAVIALGVRSAGLVGIAIPTSFLIGFFIMGTMDLTLNMMVMFGMVLSVGILVDGAIVVVEYADRKMSEGLDRVEAYALASKRMFWPIVSSTATTLAAFVPLLFWPGVPGKFMMHLPISLIFVLSASLVTAMVFVPVLGALIGKSEKGNQTTMKALAATESGDVGQIPGVTGAYAKTVANLINRPIQVIAVSFGVTATVIALFWQFNNGVEFFFTGEPDDAFVIVAARGNLSAEEMRDLTVDVENIVRNVDGIKTAYTQSGIQSGGGNMFSGGTRSDMIGRIFVEFDDWQIRTRKGSDILQDLRDQTSGLPGIVVEVQERDRGPEDGKDIQIEVTSFNETALLRETAKVRAKLESMEGVIEIEDSRPLPGIEWELQVDRTQAGRFGADIVQVGAAVQLVTNGVKIGEYRPDDAEDEVEIRARYPEDARGINQLDTLRLSTPMGLVPISNFVERVPAQKVSRIERVDGSRVYTVNANSAQGYLATKHIDEINEWLATDANIDPLVRVYFGGSDEERRRSEAFLSSAFLASLFLMAIILLTQFNSFYHSFLILSSVIFSTVGVLIGMMVFQHTFSVIMTGTGILALAGIVVNNNIVLIDTYQRLVAQGYDKVEAVVRTAAQRLRPVFLTTVTTICGLLPMVFQININFIDRDVTFGGPISYWWVQLSTAVVSGLAFSTVLTLALTPVLLALPTVVRTQNTFVSALFGWMAPILERGKAIASGRDEKRLTWETPHAPAISSATDTNDTGDGEEPLRAAE